MCVDPAAAVNLKEAVGELEAGPLGEAQCM